MIDITIRRMTLEDVDEVYKIEQSCFSVPWSKQSFIDEMTKNVCARYLVAVYKEKIVAYAGVWIIIDEGHITNIAVKQSYRNNGVATLLTSSLLQYCSNLGVKYLTLEVRRSNIIAQKLYTKLGFFKVNIRKNYYEDNNEDAILMVNDKLPEVNVNFSE